MKSGPVWAALAAQDAAELEELLRAKLRVKARLSESARLAGKSPLLLPAERGSHE